MKVERIPSDNGFPIWEVSEPDPLGFGMYRHLGTVTQVGSQYRATLTGNNHGRGFRLGLAVSLDDAAVEIERIHRFRREVFAAAERGEVDGPIPRLGKPKGKPHGA